MTNTVLYHKYYIYDIFDNYHIKIKGIFQKDKINKLESEKLINSGASA